MSIWQGVNPSTMYQSRKKHMAKSDAYGVRLYERTAIYTEALFRDLAREMPDVTSFTRDDLMHLSTFSHVALVTRYMYVRQCVNYALDNNKILSVDRGTFIMVGTKRRYKETLNTTDEYDATILQMVNHLDEDEEFRVPTLLGMWDSDPHLSESSKRSLLREALKRLERRGLIESAGGVALYKKVMHK
jgi:hypothetical protein